MLTRNLYRLDEVKAALSWSIKSRRDKEVAFWTQELIDSELYEDLFETLRTTWLWFFGIQAIDWYLQFQAMMESPDPVSEEQILGFACTLSHQTRDASVFVLVAYGALDVKEPDRVSSISVPKGLSTLEAAFHRACLQRKTRLAFDLCRIMSDDQLLICLQRIKTHAFLSHLSLDSLANKAAAVAFICMKEDPKPIRILLHYSLHELIEEWATLKGRARRVYAVPHHCLYFITKRGRQKNTVSSRKEGWITSLAVLRGSPFWTTAIETVVDDESKETFYETHFPDDIPDEWSLEDQQKSHGIGCLIGDETPSTEKYLRNWYLGINSIVWLGVKDVLRLLKGAEFTESIEELYDPIKIKDAMKSWHLTPVTRRVKEIIPL